MRDALARVIAGASWGGGGRDPLAAADAEKLKPGGGGGLAPGTSLPLLPEPGSGLPLWRGVAGTQLL